MDDQMNDQTDQTDQMDQAPTPQFTITRVFDAPRDVIWKAWTDPVQASVWWHPRGISTPASSVHLDPRVGGHYSYTMVNDATGEEYPTAGTYIEIDEPERLVFTWGNPGDEDAPVVSITLRDVGEQTEMIFHVDGIDGAPGDGNVFDGWSSAFGILTDELAD